jgi:hypothetical protein
MSAAAQILPRPRRKGFSPFPNEVLQDWARLVSGDAQVFSLMLIVSETLGAVPENENRKPEWSRSISSVEFADFARCSVRAIQAAIEDLVSRKVLERRGPKTAPRYRIPFESWPELPDRPAKIVTLEAANEPEQDTAEEAEQRTRGKVIPVYDKPVRFKRGSRPRPKELPAPAGKLRILTDQDVECSAQMCDGLLDIHLNVVLPESGANKKREQTQSTALLPPKSLKHIPRPNFEQFETWALKCEMSCSPADLAKARKIWASAKPCADGKLLTAEEMKAALQGLEDRFISGELPGSAEFRPLPQNYLANKLWLRPLRKTRSLPRKKTASESFDCGKCFDTGLIVPDTGNQSRDMENARPCTCEAGKEYRRA